MSTPDNARPSFFCSLPLAGAAGSLPAATPSPACTDALPANLPVRLERALRHAVNRFPLMPVDSSAIHNNAGAASGYGFQGRCDWRYNFPPANGQLSLSFPFKATAVAH